jgi:cytochrome c oxidase cbb3-type subunit 4
MDVNEMRIVVTVLSMVMFIGIVWWTYAKPRGFEEAQMLPFLDGDTPPAPSGAAEKQAQGARP